MEYPKHISFSQEDILHLAQRIETSNLSTEDRDLILQLVDFNSWLENMLQEAKISISRLKRIFGISARTPKKIDPPDASSSWQEPKPVESLDSTSPSSSQKPSKRKGHGRRKSDTYWGATEIDVPHQSLKAQDPCPLECGGRLAPSRPGIIIRMTGSPLIAANRYIQEKLRCALCGELFPAALPESCSTTEKYDEKAKALLVHYKYWLGLPFNRMAHFQELVGIPLPGSTQFELAEKVADCLYPIYWKLIDLSAQSSVIHNDDTKVRILSLMKENRINPDILRKGMFTTGIVAIGEHEIVLFFSGRSHAGENLKSILQLRRSSQLIVHMADGLAASQPKDTKTHSCICWAHVGRKFEEIEAYWPEECAYVLEMIAQIYQTDRKAKESNFSAEERLERHQIFSIPLLGQLRAWLDWQLENNSDGSNSSFGEALAYLDNHWEKLTLFTRIAGVPLDNNPVERSLKIPIRIRNSSLFYKTEHGAKIGDIVMSVIATAHVSGINPVDYLVAVQKNRSSVHQFPEGWLPWNYSASLSQCA